MGTEVRSKYMYMGFTIARNVTAHNINSKNIKNLVKTWIYIYIYIYKLLRIVDIWCFSYFTLIYKTNKSGSVLALTLVRFFFFFFGE